MTTYQVVAIREDGMWLADVPGAPGAHTYARSLPALLESIREVIVLMDDLPDDAVPEVCLTFDVAVMLHITPGRVSQLTHPERSARPASA